jgi:hypothetical protein
MLIAPRRGSQETGYVFGRGDEAGWAGLAGGEILSTHVHRSKISADMDYDGFSSF